MRHDIHMSALRAAARVAFATGVLVGCTSSVEESETTTSDLTNTDSDTNADGNSDTNADSTTADASLPSADAGLDPSWLPCCWMVPSEDPAQCTWSGPGCTPWGPPVPPAMRPLARA